MKQIRIYAEIFKPSLDSITLKDNAVFDLHNQKGLNL